MFQGEALLVWAFMGWKYRQETNKWNNQKNWHNELFKRMQANAGCLCNWKNPILGTEFVTQCCSYCTLWLPYALSVAAAVDFLLVRYQERWWVFGTLVMMNLYNGCQTPFNQMLRALQLLRQSLLRATCFQDVFPFFFPDIRTSAGLCPRSYLYTYVLSWKAFKVTLMGTVVYSDDVFYPVLMVCALFFIMVFLVRSRLCSTYNTCLC